MVDRTSQLSRIAQSPAATDLSGGKASETLSTVRRNNLAAEDAVCFQSESSLDMAVPTRPGSEPTGLPTSSVRCDDTKGRIHVLSDSPTREAEEMGDLFPMSARGGGLTWSVLFPSTSLPPRLDSPSVCTYECGRRYFWLVSPSLALSSPPPWPSPISTADRETNLESPGRGPSFPPPSLTFPPLNSPSTTMPGSDCKDKVGWSNSSPPTLARLFPLLSLSFESLSFTFFRNPGKHCWRLMSSQDWCRLWRDGRWFGTWLPSFQRGLARPRRRACNVPDIAKPAGELHRRYNAMQRVQRIATAAKDYIVVNCP